MMSQLRSLRFSLALGFLLLASLAAGAESKPVRVLFLGNSYLFGSGSSSRFFRPKTVTDLNQANIGGVPALFKSFTQAAGLAYDVNLELSSGQGFDYHLAKKAELIGQRWDLVVMQSFSLLDQAKPGDPALMIRSAKALGELFARFNPQVDIRLIATWPRADAVYPETGRWHGQGIEGMARDVRAAYDQAAAVTPQVRGVIPVGESWLRAISSGFADGNPYDGIAFGQVSLWTHDYHHASNYGYYLEALMIFGHVTGLDPRSLGDNDAAAFELGMAPEQAGTLQKVAAEQLLAAGTKLAPFKSLTPAPKRRVE